MSDKIFVLRESWIESAKRDVTSAICAVAVISPGVLMESSAMQWAGFIMLAIPILSRAAGIRKKAERTPEQMILEAKEIIAQRDAA